MSSKIDPSEKDDPPTKGEIARPGTSAARESIVAMALEQFGHEYKPTEAQFDKMIALREKAMDYTHDERMNMTSQQKVDIFVFGGVVIALIAYHTNRCLESS